MRRMLGWVLIVMATAGLFPLLTQVSAIQRGQVETPSTDPAVYRISSTNSLVTCSVPTTIVLKQNAPNTGAFFQCTNNYGSSIYLSWRVVDDGGTGLTASDGDTLIADGTAACRQVSLRAGSGVDPPVTVVFAGQTGSSAGFYADIFFTGQIQVLKGASAGGGCP